MDGIVLVVGFRRESEGLLIGEGRSTRAVAGRATGRREIVPGLRFGVVVFCVERVRFVQGFFEDFVGRNASDECERLGHW